MTPQAQATSLVVSGVVISTVFITVLPQFWYIGVAVLTMDILIAIFLLTRAKQK